MPSALAFEATVDELLDRFPDMHVRAFGEMVNLLAATDCRPPRSRSRISGTSSAASATSRCCCGYQLNVFDRSSQAGLLPEVCRAHSHILPALDPARLTRAVDQALEEVLGAAEAGKVYVLVGQQLRSDRVPMAQVLLMWISANMPALAERVLASARARYEALPASA